MSAQSIQRWSTHQVPVQAQLDYWVGAICDAFLEMDCLPVHSSKAGFEGTLLSLPVGPLRFNQVLAAPSKVNRTAAAVARSQAQPFYLITDLHQPWRIRQNGVEIDLRPRDLALVDSSQQYQFEFPGAVKNMSIEIPRQWLAPWLTEIDTKTPRRIGHDAGWGQSLSALCGQFANDPLLSKGYPAQLLTEQIGAMLGACLDANNPDQSAKSNVVKAATELIWQRLAEPAVTAAVIAQQMGLSSRTLHRYFAAEGLTFAHVQRKIRMDHAAGLLAQKRLSNLDMSAIGIHCGVSDASNFVREFRRVYGCTPAKWRKEHLKL